MSVRRISARSSCARARIRLGGLFVVYGDAMVCDRVCYVSRARRYEQRSGERARGCRGWCGRRRGRVDVAVVGGVVVVLVAVVGWQRWRGEGAQHQVRPDGGPTHEDGRASACVRRRASVVTVGMLVARVAVRQAQTLEAIGGSEIGRLRATMGCTSAALGERRERGRSRVQRVLRVLRALSVLRGPCERHAIFLPHFTRAAQRVRSPGRGHVSKMKKLADSSHLHADFIRVAALHTPTCAARAACAAHVARVDRAAHVLGLLRTLQHVVPRPARSPALPARNPTYPCLFHNAHPWACSTSHTRRPRPVLVSAV